MQGSETRTQHLGVLVSVVVVVHVFLISVQVNAQPGAGLLEAVGTAVFGLVGEGQRVISGARTAVTDVWSSYAGVRQLRGENDELSRRVAHLELQLQQQRALAEQARGLERLLALRETVPLPTLSARVIGTDATPYFRTLTIDRGYRAGVLSDQAVLAPSGVVGRITGTPGARAARIQLLVDRNAAAGALIERTRASGVIVGTDEIDVLQLEYVSNLEDVLVGDRIVTSGTDGIYPRGFLIGRVARVAPGAGLYRTIDVEPSVEFSQVEDVLVVVETPPADADDVSGPLARVETG